MIICISDIWEPAAEQHANFLESLIDTGLSKLGDSTLDRYVYQFIVDHRDTIIHGTASSLQSSIDDYIIRFGTSLLRECAGTKFKKIFDYSNFSLKSNKPWTAYHLCNQARYQTCSYCQLVTTDTFLPNKKQRGYRPPIDHYYGKAEYPFLALTLSNFIPCCEKCNGSQMKGSIDFAKCPHLNPLIDEECIEFAVVSINSTDITIAEAITLNLPKENYRLALYIKNNHQKSDASIKTFQLDARYRHYDGQAYFLAKMMRGFPARISMHREALDFETSIDDYLEFHPDAYKTVPYGKARLCIAKQFGALPD